MSIINKPPEMVKREYDLQEPVAQAIEKYAIFMQSTPDHAVNSAWKMIIWKDAEFRPWRKQQQANLGRKQGAVSSQAAKA
jgi:hypothetical protein